MSTPPPSPLLTSTGQLVSTGSRQWGPFVLIPGPDGAPFKAEAKRDGVEPGTLERFTVWIDGDPREDPHDHPWPFESLIVTGGYTELRYRRQEDGSYLFIGEFTYTAGDRVLVPAGDAHVVYDVLPGTTTHMFIGKLVAGPGDWGHVVNGRWEKNVPSRDFLERLTALKPPV